MTCIQVRDTLYKPTSDRRTNQDTDMMGQKKNEERRTKRKIVMMFIYLFFNEKNGLIVEHTYNTVGRSRLPIIQASRLDE